jgi:hypothetical protein
VSFSTAWLYSHQQWSYGPSYLCQQIPELCLDAARRLWKSNPAPCFSVVSEEEVAVGLERLEDRNRYNSDQYQALLGSVIDAMEHENL